MQPGSSRVASFLLAIALRPCRKSKSCRPSSTRSEAHARTEQGQRPVLAEADADVVTVHRDVADSERGDAHERPRVEKHRSTRGVSHNPASNPSRGKGYKQRLSGEVLPFDPTSLTCRSADGSVRSRSESVFARKRILRFLRWSQHSKI